MNYSREETLRITDAINEENRRASKIQKLETDGAKLIRETAGAYWFRLTDGTMITVPKN